MVWGWSLFFALWSAHATAQSVHKCVAPTGAVSYQSGACTGNSREAANWEAPSDPPPSGPPHPSSSKPEGERSLEPRSARADRTHLVRDAPKPSACEIAKADRDATLERVGLKRTFDLLSRLDEQVRKACR